MRVEDWNWIGEDQSEVSVKVRSLAPPVRARLKGDWVRFARAEYGVAPGQAAVVYAGTVLGPDVIIGRTGLDQIHGRGGDDVICGGKGDDFIIGGDGDDRRPSIASRPPSTVSSPSTCRTRRTGSRLRRTRRRVQSDIVVGLGFWATIGSMSCSARVRASLMTRSAWVRT